MNRRIRHFTLAAALAAAVATTASAGTNLPPGTVNPLISGVGLPGFVVLAEQRYDPAVQRFMAEQSLRALPLYNGQLFYIYPREATGQLEHMQIRYLQVLLDEKAADEARDNVSINETDSEPAEGEALPTR